MLYYLIKGLGAFVCRLPLPLANGFGWFLGRCAYRLLSKHRQQVYANLKMALADEKSPWELKRITKKLFCNYGKNIIEILRLPSLTPEVVSKTIDIQGKEYLQKALHQGKGVLIVAMHFGSWEVASVALAMLGYPYKVMVKTQEKFSKLDELLTEYRSCGGSVILSRGMGTRDLLKSLRRNEMNAMVIDQGGRHGVLMPFFGRGASMSDGAVRIALKQGTPILFVVMLSQPHRRYQMRIHAPLDLRVSGNKEVDIKNGLMQLTSLMETYVRQAPDEYMWFYKVWKYSNEARVVILNDGKMGHYRQSETAAALLRKAAAQRGIDARVQTCRVVFRSPYHQKLFALGSVGWDVWASIAKLRFLKAFVTEETWQRLSVLKPSYVISCGSSMAGVNRLLSWDLKAKSVAILKPGLFNFKAFDCVVMPQHDHAPGYRHQDSVVITRGALNGMTPAYLKSQTDKLLLRYDHLNGNVRCKIGLFIGGDAKHVYVSSRQVRILINQLRSVLDEWNATILLTTSRRTPPAIVKLFQKAFRRQSECLLLIDPYQEDVPEAVGGILGLSDVVIVSGDSISMVCEAASSGKKTMAFYPETRAKVLKANKHHQFLHQLHDQGYVCGTSVQNLSRSFTDMMKNKIQVRTLDDKPRVLDAMCHLI